MNTPSFKAVVRFPEGGRLEVSGPSILAGIETCFASITDEYERAKLIDRLQERHKHIRAQAAERAAQQAMENEL